MSNSQEKLNNESVKIDYERIAQSKQFNQFIKEKRRFILPWTIFFFIFYFLLPIFTSYTTFLNTSVIGDISWLWLFAFSQFIMTWVLSSIYVKKAATFDEKVDEIIESQTRKGGKY